MSIAAAIAFDTAGSFTHDSSLIEFSGSVARPKNLRPSNVTYFADYATSINATYALNSEVSTASGAVVITSGKLNLTGGTVKYIDIDATNLNPNIFTLRLGYVPNFSGNSVQAIAYVGNGGSSAVNKVELFQINANLIATVYNSSGVQIFSLSTPISPVSGVEMEIELNVNTTAGINSLLINGGARVASSATGARTAASIFRIGNDGAGLTVANFSLAYLVVTNDVQHTTTYTPAGANVQATKYSLADPTLLLISTFTTDRLLSFSATTSVSGSDLVKYVAVKNGSYFYYNGSSWVASDGTYAQSNTAAEIDAAATDFDLSAGVQLSFLTFLHSADGSTRPTITAIDITYDFFLIAPTAPNVCAVYLRIEDVIGDTVTDATLVVTLAKSFSNSGYVVTAGVYEFAFNADGYVDVSLVESETPNKKYAFKVTYVQDGETREIAFKAAVVPNAVSASLLTISSVA